MLTGVGGCVRDDGGVGDGGEEIRFGVGASRAAVDGTSFPDGSSFDVWGWRDDADGGLVSVFDGTPVTLNGGAWSYEGLK